MTELIIYNLLASARLPVLSHLECIRNDLFRILILFSEDYGPSLQYRYLYEEESKMTVMMSVITMMGLMTVRYVRVVLDYFELRWVKSVMSLMTVKSMVPMIVSETVMPMLCEGA